MSDYVIPNDGIIQLKMTILMEVLNFIYSKNMMGSFSGSNNKLVTEKLVGNVRGATIDANGIVCIFEKLISDEKYNVIRYLEKDVPKKNCGKIIEQPVDFLSEIKNLDIVKEKVDEILF